MTFNDNRNAGLWIKLKKIEKSVDIFKKMVYNEYTKIEKVQVSPSGMAAASQAVPGEFDSRHLLQKKKRTQTVRFSFWKIK